MSQDELVGVKCRCQRERAGCFEPLAHELGLVRGEIVEHDVDLEGTRHGAIEVFEEAEDVLSGVRILGVVEYLPGRHVHRCEEIRGAVAPPRVIEQRFS